MKDDRFLNLARKFSLKAKHHTHKLGAVVVRGSKILGTGFNVNDRKSANSPHNYKSIHAEYMAYLNSAGDIKGSTMYIYRSLKDGSPAIARPCPSCLNFLIRQGVKKIVYSFDGKYIKEKL